MTGFTGAAVGVAVGAGAERRRQMLEEQELTPYSPNDLAQDWEFKIVRSAMGGFRKPEFLQRVLDDEARAGWVLVEKFDNTRIRLKRPAQARERDGKLDFDPYRTDVGPQDFATIAIPLVLLAAALLMMVAMAMFR